MGVAAEAFLATHHCGVCLPSLCPTRTGRHEKSLPMSADSLSAAESVREKGNNAFKAKEYVQALESYAEALRLLGPMPSEGELAQRRQDAMTKCRLNRAACLLKIQGFNAASFEAKAVIEVEPGNAKPVFRREYRQGCSGCPTTLRYTLVFGCKGC